MYEKRDQRGIDLPCPRPDAIEGDGPIQYCARCDSAVYDFSALSTQEAEALEAANAQRTFCARVQFDGRQRRHRAPSSLRTVGLALGLGLGGLVVAQWAVHHQPESPGAGAVGPSGIREQGPAALRKSVNAAIDAAARSTTPGPRRLTESPHHANAHHPDSARNGEVIERGLGKESASTQHHQPPVRIMNLGTMVSRNTPVSGGIPPQNRRVGVGSTSPRVHADTAADLLSGSLEPAKR